MSTNSVFFEGMGDRPFVRLSRDGSNLRVNYLSIPEISINFKFFSEAEDTNGWVLTYFVTSYTTVSGKMKWCLTYDDCTSEWYGVSELTTGGMLESTVAYRIPVSLSTSLSEFDIASLPQSYDEAVSMFGPISPAILEAKASLPWWETLSVTVSDLQHALQMTPYANYCVGPFAACELMTDAVPNFAFAVVSYSGKNVLCVFLQNNDTWSLHIANEKALFPGEGIPYFEIDNTRWDVTVQYPSCDQILSMTYQTHAKMDGSIDWTFHELITSDTLKGSLESLQIRRDIEEKTWTVLQPLRTSIYRGNTPHAISEFDISTFPKTMKDIKSKWRLIKSWTNSPNDI
jgi:hypothetical protein